MASLPPPPPPPPGKRPPAAAPPSPTAGVSMLPFANTPPRPPLQGTSSAYNPPQGSGVGIGAPGTPQAGGQAPGPQPLQGGMLQAILGRLMPGSGMPGGGT